jgi:hypothetical protein
LAAFKSGISSTVGDNERRARPWRRIP